MSDSDCPYCKCYARRPNEPTCGTPYCIDEHVKVQASRAEAAEADDSVLARGYRCDSCGHEQEADVACESCGSHGVVPFGYQDPPDAVEDTARLYDSAVSPGEEERRRPRPGCKHCRLIGELCGLCERLEQGELPEPSPAARSIAASTGLDPHTVALTIEIERVCKAHGLARTQYALASALWRSVSSHPVLRMTVDFIVGRLVLSDGGRRISFEADVFPPRPVEVVREAVAACRSAKEPSRG
jgi:hypothetical protein